METCHTSKALCRKCRNTRCHSVDIQTWLMGGVALSALLIRWHLESGVQPPRMRSEQRLMKSVWRAECWKELQGRMSMWASLCPPVCPSTVSLPLDLPLRVLKRVIVWHHPKEQARKWMLKMGIYNKEKIKYDALLITKSFNCT